MSEMIERVARAICTGAGDYSGPWQDFIPEARAAILAMREPTEAVLDAGPPSPYMDPEIWAKMIDAALAEPL